MNKISKETNKHNQHVHQRLKQRLQQTDCESLSALRNVLAWFIISNLVAHLFNGLLFNFFFFQESVQNQTTLIYATLVNQQQLDSTASTRPTTICVEPHTTVMSG